MPKPTDHNWYPPWTPRFWNGMRMRDYYVLMRQNRFQIHPSRYGMAFMVACCSVVNSTLAGIQNLAYGRKIETAELPAPPVFVVGHWRSGTTLLHELLSLDQRMAFPNNFDAFTPNHFLISKSLLYPLVKLLMPARRPMDNMSMGIASPQEDDFALCGYGAPTPYRRVAFPNRPGRDHMLLDLSNADADQLMELKSAMQKFLRTLTVRYQLPLVLKSPPHTGRIEKLAEWFPGAKFVHISRHPYKLVPSTMRLWKTIDKLQGFQVPKYDDAMLKNYIFECQDLMYSAYFEQKPNIPAEQLTEIRFEDLVANPIAEMSQLYDRLGLGEFDQVQPALETYFEHKKDHQTNPFELDESLRLEIDTCWHGYKTAFGYD